MTQAEPDSTCLSTSRWLSLPVPSLGSSSITRRSRGTQRFVIPAADGFANLGQFQSRLVGHGDESLALFSVRQRHHRHLAFLPVLRERPGQGILHRGETDHLAADLGEALDPAPDPEVAVGSDVDNVAGVVPAAERLERRVGVGVEVTLHHVGAADEQAAGVRHAVDRLEFPLAARQQPAHGAEPVVDLGVGAARRGALGHAVCLVDADTELARPCVGRGLLNLLRAGEQIAHAPEIVRMRLARIAVKERVGAQKHRRVGVVNGGRDLPVLQRRRKQGGANPPAER